MSTLTGSPAALRCSSTGCTGYARGQAVGPHLSPFGALVFSVTSFHRWGFSLGGIRLDDLLTSSATMEAFVGLLI